MDHDKRITITDEDGIEYVTRAILELVQAENRLLLNANKHLLERIGELELAIGRLKEWKSVVYPAQEQRIKELEGDVERLQGVADELDKELFDKKPPITHSQVTQILADAREDVKAGRMSGIDASMLKWDTLIEYSERTNKMHPAWCNACGLCVEFRIASDCVRCPLRCCGAHSLWDALSIAYSGQQPEQWLMAARKFRTWIRDTYDAWAKKQERQDEWVYSIVKSRTGYALYSPGGCIWGGVPGADSEILEELIPLLIKKGINIATPKKYCTSDSYVNTPIFGVRKLRAGEQGHTAKYKYGAFRSGKFIIGSQSRTPEGCIKDVLAFLTPAIPAKPATPAKTLADLETAP